ncbi:MAG TPA: hypothetical protein PLQ93_04290 [Bacteroidia bacterium]|nr:hypothetical protein [Bacteroidia bacterium]
MIGLLATYLLSLTELHELVKLPLLAQHYREHCEKNASLSFWDFLCVHYTQENGRDDDQDRDASLPFKSYDGCMSSLSVAIQQQHGPNINHHFFSTGEEAFADQPVSYLPTSYLSSIWQPPRSL